MTYNVSQLDIKRMVDPLLKNNQVALSSLESSDHASKKDHGWFHVEWFHHEWFHHDENGHLAIALFWA